MTNGNAKGKAGEREAAAFLRLHGFSARRGQQFSGGSDSPDVVTDLPFHVEVKRVESLNLGAAIEQAKEDSGGSPWIVLHRKNRQSWLVTMDASAFLQLVKQTQTESNHNDIQPASRPIA